MQRSNKVLKFEVRFEDGEVLSEQCRDSLGGWSNMADRLVGQFGTVAWDRSGGSGVIGGRRFEIVAVG